PVSSAGRRRPGRLTAEVLSNGWPRCAKERLLTGLKGGGDADAGGFPVFRRNGGAEERQDAVCDCRFQTHLARGGDGLSHGEDVEEAGDGHSRNLSCSALDSDVESVRQAGARYLHGLPGPGELD